METITQVRFKNLASLKEIFIFQFTDSVRDMNWTEL